MLRRAEVLCSGECQPFFAPKTICQIVDSAPARKKVTVTEGRVRSFAVGCVSHKPSTAKRERCCDGVQRPRRGLRARALRGSVVGVGGTPRHEIGTRASSISLQKLFSKQRSGLEVTWQAGPGVHRSEGYLLLGETDDVAQVGAGEVGGNQVGATELAASQIGSGQVGPGEIDA